MYSVYALYISVTIFCNSLPLKTYAAKTCESLGKNKKFWKMNIIDDLHIIPSKYIIEPYSPSL